MSSFACFDVVLIWRFCFWVFSLLWVFEFGFNVAGLLVCLVELPGVCCLFVVGLPDLSIVLLGNW